MLGASVLIATQVFHYPGDVVLGVTLLGIGYVFSGFAENLGAYFQALEQMRVWLEASIWFGLLSGALGIVLVVLTHSVAWFCLGFAFGQLGSLLWLLRRLPPSVRVWSHAALSDAKHLVRAALPFGAAFFALTVFYKFDALLLNLLESTRVVGLYAAGYKLVDVAHALAVVASVAIYPRLARLTVAAQRAQPAARALELFLLGGALAAGGLWLVRTPLTFLLFGNAYAVTADVLALLAPALAALTITILSGYLLSAADRVVVLAVAYTIAIGVKLTLGLWLIPELGAPGMAAAMLIAESTLALILMYALARQALGTPRIRVFALATGAGVLTALTHRLIPAEPWLALVLYAFAVAAWYALGGALSRAEWNALLHALRVRTQAA
jgi:O-antigen/teichoic acid export membrane protein